MNHDWEFQKENQSFSNRLPRESHNNQETEVFFLTKWYMTENSKTNIRDTQTCESRESHNNQGVKDFLCRQYDKFMNPKRISEISKTST